MNIIFDNIYMNNNFKISIQKLFYNMVVNILLVIFLLGTYYVFNKYKNVNPDSGFHQWIFLALIYGIFSLFMNISLWMNNYMGGNHINISYYNILYFSFIVILFIIEVLSKSNLMVVRHS